MSNIKSINDIGHKRQAVEHGLYRGTHEMYVLNKIDKARGAKESNDVYPGVIRTKFGFRCSAKTPYGWVKNFFSEESEAINWVKGVHDQFKDHCYDR